MKKKILFGVIGVIAVLCVLFLIMCAQRGYTPFYAVSRVVSKIEAKFSDKQVEIINDGGKVINEWTKGYSAKLPSDMVINTENYQEYITAENETLSVTITREWAPYEDVLWYIENYQNNYILNEHYQKENNIEIYKNESFLHGKASARLVNLERKTGRINDKNNYTYFYVLAETAPQAFFRIMAKTSDYEKDGQKIDEIINSFKEIPIKGEVKKYEKHKRVKKEFDKATQKLYDDILNADKIKWGIFVDGAYTNENEMKHLSEIEKNTESNFEFSLYYVNLDGNFPIKELEKMYQNGKYTELTLQISNHYNSDLFGKNPNFDVYDGLMDDEIRSFAKGAKEFGKPFLFRLNNEMNSDWVNYSGVAALSDPEIFKSNWIRIYDIFKEEGVNNAIWIFNPNNEDCPPSHWNSYLAYYPGDKYVDMIGMTGYNTGTYYLEEFNETWRTFDEINKEQYQKLMKSFSSFPFIITEFASSSVGGNKEEWILDMFEAIKEYPNIKMALWWSSRDYDFRDETYTKVARPYFLDETANTTEAFRKGMKRYNK